MASQSTRQGARLLPLQVNRSTALLKSLSAERERWEKTSETFKNQMSTIAGDCLLSAAFIAYAGYFDQQMRQNLFTTWSHHLQQANIQVTGQRRARHAPRARAPPQVSSRRVTAGLCSSAQTSPGPSTCPTLMSACAGRPAPCPRTTCALRTPSC